MRNGLPYYKAYPRDFVEGTIGMPFEVKCAYRVVLDLIYMQGGNLPGDARYISGLLGCSIRKWKSIREALIKADKIQVSGEFLTNKRAEKEIETLSKLQDKQREKAAKPRKNKGLQEPQLSQPEPEPYIREDTNVSSCPKSSKSEGFDAFWSVWPSKVSKQSAKKAWGKLSIESKREAYRAVSGGWFERWQARNPDANPIHAATFLNQRRWEDDLSPQLMPINGGLYHDHRVIDGSKVPNRPQNRPDPALDQIARLAGIVEAPGNGGH